jgi:hypothetical protein
MKVRKKLSIVITARNDNYIDHFINRLEFSINYFLYNTDKLGFIKNIEFIVVDWGSEKHISKDFSVIKKSYRDNIVFIELNKNESLKHSRNVLGGFFTEKAVNLGIANSSGNYVLVTQHDTIFSISSIRNIFSLINDKVFNENFIWIPRKYMNYQFYNTNPNFNDLDRYISRIFFSKLKFENLQFQNGGGASAILFGKNNFIISKLLDENAATKGYFSGSDIELLKRVSVKFNHLDSSAFGIYGLKLPRAQLTGTKIEYIKKLTKKNYPFEYSKDSYKKNMLSKIKFNVKKCINVVKEIKIVSSKNDYNYLNLKTVIRIFWHTIYSIGKLSNFISLFRVFILLKDIPIRYYIELGSNYSSRIPYISKIFTYMEIYSLNLQRNNSNNFKTQFYIKLNRYLNRTHDGYYRFLYTAEIINLKNFFLNEKFRNFTSFVNFNLEEFDEKEILELLKIIKNKNYNFGAILFENILNSKKIFNFLILNKEFKDKFFNINISRNCILLVNNRIKNLNEIKKKLLHLNISLNLIYYCISYIIFYLAILKKYFYFFKRKIKLT